MVIFTFDMDDNVFLIFNLTDRITWNNSTFQLQLVFPISRIGYPGKFTFVNQLLKYMCCYWIEYLCLDRPFSFFNFNTFIKCFEKIKINFILLILAMVLSNKSCCILIKMLILNIMNKMKLKTRQFQESATKPKIKE